MEGSAVDVGTGAKYYRLWKLGGDFSISVGFSLSVKSFVGYLHLVHDGKGYEVLV